MKLLTRTSYILVTTVLFIFFAGAVVFYLVLKSATEREVQEELLSHLDKISLELQKAPENYSEVHFPAYLEIQKKKALTSTEPFIQDTLLLDTLQREYKQYTVLTCDRVFKEQAYHIAIYRSRTESNALIERILLITSTIILLYVALTYILNRYMFARAWNDFFQTLKQLNDYDINRGRELEFANSDILEFELLNATLREMTSKLQKDYEDIRNFTGNVSHEIQTPLTIIKQKAEQLIQTEPISRKQALLIADIQKSVSRLSRLNKTLILQTRIESRQFDRKENIDIPQQLHFHLEEFQAFLEEKKLQLHLNIQSSLRLEADPMLIDILLVNLIKNAIWHNYPNGSIHLSLTKEILRISNSGNSKAIPADSLFKRYVRSSEEAEGLGLGLSLVKGICELYGYGITYKYENKEHTFNVNFIR